MTQPIVLYAAYDKDGDAVTGLTVTVNVYRITRSTGASSQIVTGGSATEVGTGVYLYAIAAADLQTYDYVAAFATAGDVTSANQWAVYPALANAYGTELARLDAAVSTRLATADYSAAPTASAVADAVWDEALSGHATAGSAGAALSAAGGAADPLANTLDGYASGTGGAALKRISAGQLTVVQPVLDDGFLRIIGGDDYAAADGRRLDLSSEDWPDLTDGAVVWIFGDTTLAGVVVDADTVGLALTAAQSAALLAQRAGRQTYSIVATLATGNTATLAKGAPCLIE